MQTSISAIFFFGTFVVGGILLPKKMYKAFYALAALCIGITLGQQIPDAYKLQEHGVDADGTIRAVDCANHGRIFFEYQVNGQTFGGEETASSGGLKCGEVQVGSHIAVRYLETDPQQSVAGSFKSNLNEKILFALAGMFGAPWLIIFFHKRKMSTENGI